MRFIIAVTAVLICTASAAQKKYAQLSAEQKEDFEHVDSNRTRNKIFAQQTLNYAALSYASPPYMDYGGRKAPYILSADIIPYFVVGGTWMRFPIHLTARFKARILRNNPEEGDTSLPVRTPSFMPGASMYFPLHYVDEQTLRLRYLSLSYFHHSNGQDGREFMEDGRVNIYNGNFSTNYFEGAFHFRNRYLTKVQEYKCEGEKDPYYDLYGRAGYEQHFGTARALKKSYGDHRVNFLLGLIRVKSYCDKVMKVPVTEAYYLERYRVVFNSSAILSARNRNLSGLEHRINADLHFYWRLPASPNTSLFVGTGYYGSDPYNIYYEENYFFIRAGVALGFFVAPEALAVRRRR